LVVTFLLSNGTTIEKRYTMAPHSRLTVNVEWADPALADVAVSTTVTSDVPVVAERAMYWPGDASSWREAHNSFGTTVTGPHWGFAEGRVGQAPGFDTFILLANPNPTAATVQLTFMREHGRPTVVKTYHVQATARFNVWVNAMVPELEDENFGVVIDSTNGVPLAAERAMYWNAAGAHWASGTNATAIRMP
ncbi:MAG: hypothetical protein AB7I50_23380, partial [Vicinamibacterales bacterium]